MTNQRGMDREALGTLAGIVRVRVGTQCLPKLEATRRALARFGIEVPVDATEVETGVPEQPIGFAEITAGARTRARAAWAATEGSGSERVLGVGIEDGLVRLAEVNGAVVNVGCAWVTNGAAEGFGLSSGFAYPPGCTHPAFEGREPIGDLFDALWRSRGAVAESGEAKMAGPSGRDIGNIGKLSLGVLTRSEYGEHAVLCALLRYLHPDLYDDAGSQAGVWEAGTGAGA